MKGFFFDKYLMPHKGGQSWSSYRITLTFDDIANVPVADASSVSDWNTFFDLPTYGTPFAEVDVDGNIVTLTGGSGITLKQGIFADSCNTSLLGLEDTGAVVDIETESTLIEDPPYVLFISPFFHYETDGINETFNACTALTDVVLPSIVSIGHYAFYTCTSLTSITIPDSVTSIGEYVFGSCSSLTSITIPNSVTSIGEYAFSGCSSLTSITIPNSVTSIGENAFGSCSSLTSITIPNSVTSIGHGTFSGCSSLTSITIPNSVTSIGENAFSDCSSLTSITIPNSVTSIGENAFIACTSLTSITIPNSVTSIGEYVFIGCLLLSTVNMYPITAPTLNVNNTFDDYAATLHIVAGSTGYSVAPWTNTSKFASVVQDL